MSKREVQLDAVGHWCLEVSALLAVFPWLDQVLHKTERFDRSLVAYCIIAVLVMGIAGLQLIQSKEQI